MKMLHMVCPIFNMDANIRNSLLTLTNELTSGNSHHGANIDYHSTETQLQTASSPDEPPSNTSETERSANAGAMRTHISEED